MLLVTFLLGCATDTEAPDPVDTGSDTASDTGEPEQLDSGDTDVEDTGQEDTGDDGEDTAEEALYQSFYDVSVIQQVVIEISRDQMEAMDAEAELAYEQNPSNPVLTYVPVNLLVNGDRLDNVGLRLKGSSTFQYWNGKPSLKLKFDEFEQDQRFAGLKRATLNNMSGDPSMTREVLGYTFWRDSGLRVPRANFGQVYLVIDGGDPVYYGLYTNLEAYDSEWVERNYDDDGGELWEGNDSADFSRAGVSHFELVTSEVDEATAKAYLDDARQSVQNHGDDFYADVNDVIDMDNFLEFWAFSVAVGNRDGYPFNLNDFYTYRDPSDGRFSFAPWGMDETWDTASPKYWPYVNGDLAAFCLYYDTTCPDRYFAAQESAILTYEAADLSTLAETLQDLTATAMTDDSRKNWGGYALTTGQVESYRSQLISRIELYPTLLRNNFEEF